MSERIGRMSRLNSIVSGAGGCASADTALVSRATRTGRMRRGGANFRFTDWSGQSTRKGGSERTKNDNRRPRNSRRHFQPDDSGRVDRPPVRSISLRRRDEPRESEWVTAAYQKIKCRSQPRNPAAATLAMAVFPFLALGLILRDECVLLVCPWRITVEA
jgi:hypothetical protein